jgi:hypothetical protein
MIMATDVAENDDSLMGFLVMKTLILSPLYTN